MNGRMLAARAAEERWTWALAWLAREIVAYHGRTGLMVALSYVAGLSAAERAQDGGLDTVFRGRTFTSDQVKALRKASLSLRGLLGHSGAEWYLLADLSGIERAIRGAAPYARVEASTMAKIYCAPCFETCTGDEPACAPGLCRCCGKPIVAVAVIADPATGALKRRYVRGADALDPHAHAIPMTRELARDIATHEAGMLRRDGLEME